MGVEMLRCTQHDSVVTHIDYWINLLHCIITPIADVSALLDFPLRVASRKNRFIPRNAQRG